MHYFHQNSCLLGVILGTWGGRTKITVAKCPSSMHSPTLAMTPHRTSLALFSVLELSLQSLQLYPYHSGLKSWPHPWFSPMLATCHKSVKVTNVSSTTTFISLFSLYSYEQYWWFLITSCVAITSIYLHTCRFFPDNLCNFSWLPV